MADPVFEMGINPESVEMRRARPEDHRDVVNIRDDLFGGLDYLDAMYAAYICNENMHCFVAVEGGVIVST